ncbi:hypothetical protein TNCV_2119321 [Trichonephila clavipes]|nr:hypothetical protein TNCV_2119321 [Trichonephila clavipes]
MVRERQVSGQSVNCLPTFTVCGDTNIDLNPVAGCAVWCDVDHLWQKTEVQSSSKVRQLGAKLSVSPQTVSPHFSATGMVKNLET